MDRITDRPDMTSAVDRGCKAQPNSKAYFLSNPFKVELANVVGMFHNIPNY